METMNDVPNYWTTIEAKSGEWTCEWTSEWTSEAGKIEYEVPKELWKVRQRIHALEMLKVTLLQIQQIFDEEWNTLLLEISDGDSTKTGIKLLNNIIPHIEPKARKASWVKKLVPVKHTMEQNDLWWEVKHTYTPWKRWKQHCWDPANLVKGYSTKTGKAGD